MIAVPIAPARGGQLVFDVAPVVVAANPQPVIMQAPARTTARIIAAPPNSESGVKRTLSYSDYIDSKRRRSEKGGKGLRHFSTKVCEKVQRKGVTTYNEVADELVAEFTDPSNRDIEHLMAGYDQKNIRRRVYDALNVLMAMNIISKEKKEIRWIGLPTNSAQECETLEIEKQSKIDRLNAKLQQLHELILQQIAFKNLVQRNRELTQQQGSPSTSSVVQLPFVVLQTSDKTVIDCSISNDKSEYRFNLDRKFEIHDDTEILRRLGLMMNLDHGHCTVANLKKAVKMVPAALESYVRQLASGVNSIEELGLHRNTCISSSSTSTTARIRSSNTVPRDSADIEVANVLASHANHVTSRDPSSYMSPEADSDEYLDNNSSEEDEDEDEDDDEY